MNQLYKSVRLPDNIIQAIEYAIKEGAITESYCHDLLQEIDQQVRIFVKYFNHGSSTSLSKKNYQRIVESFNYLFIHGFRAINYDYKELNRYTISAIYSKGLEIVKEDIQKIKDLLEEVKRIQLPIMNDRYFSIIHEQIPNYLKYLDSYESIFYVQEIEEDLDYPLIDGLPLYHEMYHLKGTDLVLEYLQRFSIETRFCAYFSKDMREFITHYEKQKGVNIEWLGLNIYELILNQVIASLMSQRKIQLILEQKDIVELRSKLLHVNIEDEITQVIQNLSLELPKETAKYLLDYKYCVINSFKQFVHNGFDLLIYRQLDKQRNLIFLDPPESNQIFIKTLEYLQTLADVTTKITYLKSVRISIYDLVDLMENELFMGDEFLEYYESLSLEVIAYMIKIVCPNLGAFHHEQRLNDEFYQELDNRIEWQAYLIRFLKAMPQEHKETIEKVLNCVHIG